MFLHPDSIEREIAQAARALQARYGARRAGTWSEDDEGPLATYRRLTSRERFEQLLELPKELPTRDALRRWLAHLIVERVTWEDRATTEVDRRQADHVIVGLGDTSWSVRALTLELVRTRNEGRRRQAAESLVQVAGRTSESGSFWVRRRHAAAAQLGVDGLSWLEGPWQDVTTIAAAESALDCTEDLASDALGRGVPFQDSLWAGAAMDAREGWPARLTPRWFRTVFGHWSGLTKLRVELGPMPEPFCGASFTRALMRFGSAAHVAWGARAGVPFSLNIRPYDAGRSGYGALFGGLLASVPFLRRRLGLSTSMAQRQAHAMARSMLVAFRLNSARSVVASQTDSLGVVDAHVRYVSRALGATVPDELAAVLPRYDPRSASWLAGALHAAQLNRTLTESYDEDWFDNPRAQEEVSAVDVTRRVVLNDEAVRDGARCLTETLGEALSR